MRQLKFRIWYNGIMLYPPSPLDSMLTCRNSNGERTDITPNLLLDGRWYINGEFQQYELMQFTGLLDKNGKEIYENDILKVKIGGDLQDNYWTVDSLEQLHIEFNHDDSYYRFTEVEIVGNIYENPELLNNK